MATLVLLVFGVVLGLAWLLAPRRQRPKIKRRQVARPVTTSRHESVANGFSVDGLNVAWSYHGGKKPSLAILLNLLIALDRQGGCFWCVFDANAPHEFREGDGLQAEGVYRRLLRDFPDHFYQVRGCQADAYVLPHSHRFGTRIVSNDLYRDYHGSFPWLQERGFLVRGNCVGGQLRVPELRITETVRTDLPALYLELSCALLLRRNLSTAPPWPRLGHTIVPAVRDHPHRDVRIGRLAL